MTLSTVSNTAIPQPPLAFEKNHNASNKETPPPLKGSTELAGRVTRLTALQKQSRICLAVGLIALVTLPFVGLVVGGALLWRWLDLEDEIGKLYTRDLQIQGTYKAP